MAKPTSQERRKQALRLRRAEERREFDREDAGYLFEDAVEAHRDGDIPAADRLLKKALVLDPNHARATELLAQIHKEAGHFAEALGYLQRLRRADTNPRPLYNIAVLHHQLGQREKAPPVAPLPLRRPRPLPLQIVRIPLRELRQTFLPRVPVAVQMRRA